MRMFFSMLLLIRSGAELFAFLSRSRLLRFCCLRWRMLLSVFTLLSGLSPSVQALDTITLQLKWSHAFQFAGYYAAKEKGFYREAGLDVLFQEMRPGDDPLKIVIEGKAQYGVGNSSLLLARQLGQPVVVLASIFQHSPVIIIARKTAVTQGVHDLVGMRMMFEPQSGELLAYLSQEGVPLDRITHIPYSFRPQDLMDGKVDAISAYVTSEPYFLDRAGFAYHAYTPRSAGIDFYGDNLFTTEQELSTYPERVKAFRAASLRGWNYAMAHPEEIVDLILSKYSQEHPREYYLFEARKMASLLRNDLVEIGYMSPGRWRHIADTYADIGMLPRDFPLEGFLFEINPERDLTWFYLIGALLVSVSLIALYTLRTNHRLARILLANEKVQQALLLSEQRHRLLADNASDVIWTMDLEGRFTYVSPSVEKLRGYTSSEVMRQSLQEALIPESAAVAMEGLGKSIAAVKAGKPVPEFRGELQQPCKDGSIVWTEVTTSGMQNAAGEFVGILGVTRDISERKLMEERVRQLAFHDPLTRLPNRRLLSDRLAQAMSASKRNGLYGALMFIDLDNFKPLNDTHGHGVGDLLLIEAASRLKSCVREMDTVARFGGDEFVVMILELAVDRVESAAQAFLVAEKIREALSESYVLTIRNEEAPDASVEHNCTASIGLTLFTGHENSQEAVLDCADAAMYHAKDAGRNRVHGSFEALQQSDNDESLAEGFVKLAWHPAYECGHPLIDEQHRTLFVDANKLLTAILSGFSTVKVSELIDVLIRDVIQHFEDEEAILEKSGFPNVKEHALIHRQLVESAVVLVGRFHAGSLAIGDVFEFLANDVVARHMLGADREFFPYLGNSAEE